MTEPNYDEMRRAMVASQLRTTGVSDLRVVEAMGAVAREGFVPDDRRAMAYADTAVPLGAGRALSAPMALGRLLSEARPSPRDRVLVVAAGTGYAAAVLARLTQHVVALEEDAALAERARAALADTKIELVEGSLVDGHRAGAPYDLILIDGAVEQVPDALAAQLADGGRLVAAIVERGVTRLAIGRLAGGAFAMMAFADAATPILPAFARTPAFTF